MFSSPMRSSHSFSVCSLEILQSSRRILILGPAYLRLNGVNAKEHPVFKELTRVKQYFQKIKDIETPPEKPTMALDKQAAGRFIKHGLVCA